MKYLLSATAEQIEPIVKHLWHIRLSATTVDERLVISAACWELATGTRYGTLTWVMEMLEEFGGKINDAGRHEFADEWYCAVDMLNDLLHDLNPSGD